MSPPASPPLHEVLVSAEPTQLRLSVPALWAQFREAGGLCGCRVLEGGVVLQFAVPQGAAYAVAHFDGRAALPEAVDDEDEEEGGVVLRVTHVLSRGDTDAPPPPPPPEALLPAPHGDGLGGGLAGCGHPDVLVGGVGGSGTRLVAQCLECAGALGFDMGPDQNESCDNLFYTLLFKREGVLGCCDEDLDNLLRIMCKGMGRGGENGTGAVLSVAERRTVEQIAGSDRAGPHPTGWLRERARRLERAAAGSAQHARGRLPSSKKWGWKEPNTHVLLDRLLLEPPAASASSAMPAHAASPPPPPPRFPRCKYVHVARNGLDMAHSANQNQLQLWGRHFLGHVTNRGGGGGDGLLGGLLGAAGAAETTRDGEPGGGAGLGYDGMVSPAASLSLWCSVHRRVLALGERLGPGRFLWLDFDALCRDPEPHLEALVRFLLDKPPRAPGAPGAAAAAAARPGGTDAAPLGDEDGADVARRVAALRPLVAPPSGSIGRFRSLGGTSVFRPADVAYVASLGFDTADEEGKTGGTAHRAAAAGSVPAGGMGGNATDGGVDGGLLPHRGSTKRAREPDLEVIEMPQRSGSREHQGP